MKKQLLTLFIAIGLLNSAHAQVSAYSFSQSTGTYTPITGGIVLGTTSTDDLSFVDPATPLGGSTSTGVGFSLGFNFTYNGIVFDRCAINTNGWISLGQSALGASAVSITSSYAPLSASTTVSPAILRNRIAAFGMDLKAQTGSELMIDTLGTAPNRVCVIQWSGFNKYGSTGNNYNFQIRLVETSNEVNIPNALL